MRSVSCNRESSLITREIITSCVNPDIQLIVFVLFFSHIPISASSPQPSSSPWRSSVSSRSPPCPAFTRAPPACSHHTRPTAGRSAPSMTLRPPKTTSWLLSRERLSPYWTTGEFLQTNCYVVKWAHFGFCDPVDHKWTGWPLSLNSWTWCDKMGKYLRLYMMKISRSLYFLSTTGCD